jgi:hypothetical protein
MGVRFGDEFLVLRVLEVALETEFKNLAERGLKNEN